MKRKHGMWKSSKQKKRSKPKKLTIRKEKRTSVRAEKGGHTQRSKRGKRTPTVPFLTEVVQKGPLIPILSVTIGERRQEKEPEKRKASIFTTIPTTTNKRRRQFSSFICCGQRKRNKENVLPQRGVVSEPGNRRFSTWSETKGIAAIHLERARRPESGPTNPCWPIQARGRRKKEGLVQNPGLLARTE